MGIITKEIRLFCDNNKKLADRIEKETGIEVDRFYESLLLTVVIDQAKIDLWEKETGKSFKEEFLSDK